MAYGTVYTNGVIAVKERQLLGERLLRFPAMTEAEVLRALSESGFGAGSEDPVLAEEGALDAFIREYAPDFAHAAYFLLPRDFHNMKALFKAQLLSADPSPMLAPIGFRTIEQLRQMMEDRDPFFPWEEVQDATGAEIGAAFDRALYARLFALCKRHGTLKKLLVGKVDRINLLAALRSPDAEFAKRCHLAGGTLGAAQIEAALAGGEDALKNTTYADFFRMAYRAKEAGKPLTAAERALESFEAEYFEAQKYELSGKEPFLYYVFRRRAEIRNVRTVLIALRAGVGAAEIEKRLAGAK